MLRISSLVMLVLQPQGKTCICKFVDIMLLWFMLKVMCAQPDSCWCMAHAMNQCANKTVPQGSPNDIQKFNQPLKTDCLPKCQELYLNGVLDLLLEVMRNVVAVSNVTDAGQRHTGGESLCEAWQPAHAEVIQACALHLYNIYGKYNLYLCIYILKCIHMSKYVKCTVMHTVVYKNKPFYSLHMKVWDKMGTKGVVGASNTP